MPPSTHMLPARSKVNPSEPPVFAATSADDGPRGGDRRGREPEHRRVVGRVADADPELAAGRNQRVGHVDDRRRARRARTPRLDRRCLEHLAGDAGLRRRSRGAAVTSCGPALAVTIPLAVVVPDTPSTETAPGSWPLDDDHQRAVAAPRPRTRRNRSRRSPRAAEISSATAATNGNERATKAGRTDLDQDCAWSDQIRIARAGHVFPTCGRVSR